VRFRNLVVWKEAKELASTVYRLTEIFPDKEIFGLVSQMRRASISIASNIAEGSGRQHKKEFIHFLHVARGSLFELLSQAEISSELGYLHSNDFLLLERKCILLTKRIRSLANSLGSE